MECKHKLKALKYLSDKRKSYKPKHEADIGQHGLISMGWDNVAFEEKGKGSYHKSTSQIMRVVPTKKYAQEKDMALADVTKLNNLNNNIHD